jgi:hypothetical protein
MGCKTPAMGKWRGYYGCAKTTCSCFRHTDITFARASLQVAGARL